MRFNSLTLRNILYPIILITIFVGVISLTADYGNKINNTNFSHNISLDKMAKSGDALDRASILASENSSNIENIEKISAPLNYKKLDVFIINKNLSSPYKLNSELVQIDILGSLGK